MTVPARRPEDDALDNLSRIVGEHKGPTTGGWYSITQLRDALERLREERDAARVGHRVLLDAQNELIERAESAEAELERLRRHPDAWSQEAFDQQKARADAAEAEVRRLKATLPLTRITELEAINAQLARQVRRLTEGLREYGHHKQGCNQLKSPGLGRSPEFSGQECDCGLAALLSASPPDGCAEAMPEACPYCGCLTYKAVNTSLHLDAPDGAVLCDNCGKGWVHSTDENGLIQPDGGGAK